MNELVSKLSAGSHPVEVSISPQKTAEALKERLDRGYLYIKFPQTRGGTELGVRIDKEKTDVSTGDFAQKSGKVHIVGHLTLDYVKVRCVADIDLNSLAGEGHLEPLET